MASAAETRIVPQLKLHHVLSANNNNTILVGKCLYPNQTCNMGSFTVNCLKSLCIKCNKKLLVFLKEINFNIFLSRDLQSIYSVVFLLLAILRCSQSLLSVSVNVCVCSCIQGREMESQGYCLECY